MKQLYLALSIVLLCGGCDGTPPHPGNLNSIAWMQSSMEYRALTQGIYNTARHNLDRALEDKSWTALASQVPANDEQAGALGSLPPAVILDIDETVLGTLPYQAWLLKNEKDFLPISWHAWVSEASAEPVPGALDFVRYAMEKGVAVFYLSNRAARGAFDRNKNGRIDTGEEQVDLEPFTVTNLLRTGFLPQPGISNEDSVLLRAETDRDGQAKKGWSASDKTARRESLSADYRIILIMGDNINDFTANPAPGAHQARWGRSWFILPNPAYGHWERRLYDGGRGKKKSG
ncbi:MAG: 5'-nucleotidase, lipoprotein e(P4) family [Thiogranum sp.]